MALLLPFALSGIRHLPLAALKKDTSKQRAKRCDKNNKTNICDKRCQDGAVIRQTRNLSPLNWPLRPTTHRDSYSKPSSSSAAASACTWCRVATYNNLTVSRCWSRGSVTPASNRTSKPRAFVSASQSTACNERCPGRASVQTLSLAAMRAFLSEREFWAAAYLGLGTSTFLRLVSEGILPRPKHIKGVVAWDRFALDAYVDSIDDETNSVDRILRGG